MPSPEVVQRALETIRKGRAHYEYFFENLTSPGWLAPLAEAGFFKHPPAARREGDTISFVSWPESRYLARMAKVPGAASAVLEVAMGVPETDNVYVHEDLVETACGLPPAEAAELAQLKLAAWTPSPFRTLLPEKVGELIGYLAREGRGQAALELARSTLRLLPDPRFEGAGLENDLLSPEPKALIDTWGYGEILRKHGAELVSATQLRGLALLCDLLAAATRLSRRRSDDEAPQDHSEIWRPDIESESFPDRIAELLISAVRDAAFQIVERDRSQLRAVVEELRRARWLIFDRLSLHLLRRYWRDDDRLLSELLLDEGLFQAFPREYALLARDTAAALPERTSLEMARRTEEGPDPERVRSLLQSWEGREPSADDVQSWIRRWQLHRLHALSAGLSAASQEHYRALLAEFGEPPDPEDVPRETTWIGPTSPKDGAALRALTVPALVETLRSWRRAPGPRAPSPEGLGRVLSDVVGADPTRYARDALLFRGLDPTYVRALLDGLQQAAKEGRSFEWEPVLELMAWVLGQPHGPADQETGWAEHDPGWGWSRTAASRLLYGGLLLGATEIPIRYRERVWPLLASLAEDPEPTPEHEARYGGSNMDPFTLSINTTRGEAMHAVVRYALWVRASVEAGPNAADRLARGFGELPEVREVLEAHLAPTHDPSLAIRAVFGKWFPWLALLDEDWAKGSVNRIFPDDPAEADLFWAAWDAYVVFCEPYNQPFKLLSSVYRRVIDGLDTPQAEKRLVENPAHRLAEHLMVLHLRGVLDSTDPTGLLSQFYSKANDELCAHAMRFVGRALENRPADVPPEVLDRLRTLWMSRLEVVQRSPDPKKHAGELGAFGWWFASEKLDGDWALEQLELVLNLVGAVDPDHLVARRLKELAGRNPGRSIACLARMLDADREGWSLPGWEEEAKEVLKVALSSPDAEVQASAEAVIHRLGARGHWGFRHLFETLR